MKRILFRVNAGALYGLGHLMRCLALAQVASKNQFSPVFLLNAEGAELSKNRIDWVGETNVISDHTSELQEIEKLNDFCTLHQVAVLVIDGYHFSAQYRQQLAKLNCPIVCFDDMNNSGYLHADLIINGAGVADQLGYELNQPSTRLCLGDLYRVLRQSFCDVDVLPFDQREYLTVIMGGGDPKNLTIPLLARLEKTQFSGKLLVISGAAYPFIEELNQLINNSKLNVEHLHDCQQIAKSFMRTRLAISAAGGSQFELHATATPSCLVTVAENQLGATKAAVSQGWCIAEDLSAIVKHNEKQHCIKTLVQHVLILWSDQDTLLQMHCKAMATSDNRGSRRVIEQIQAL